MAGASYKNTLCLQCSLGCPLQVRVEGGAATGVEFDTSAATKGRLCARGYYVIDLLNTSSRPIVPMVRDGSVCRDASWDEAMSMTVARLRAVLEKHGPDAIAVLASPGLTNEEIRAAWRFARHVLGTDNFACCIPAGDMGMARALAQTLSRMLPLADLDGTTCCLVVGSPFDRVPVVADRLLNVRYGGRGDRLIVVDPIQTRTGWFASLHLRCTPGAEALVMAGILKAAIESNGKAAVSLMGAELARMLGCTPTAAIAEAAGVSMREMAMAAKSFTEADKSTIVLAPRYGQAESFALAALSDLLLHAAKNGVGLLPLLASGNAVGAYRNLSGDSLTTLAGIVESAAQGRIKAMLVFGGDPLTAGPSTITSRALEQLEFLVLSSPVPLAAGKNADVVLPSACWLEKTGTVMASSSREHRLEPVLPPPGAARPEGEILTLLAQGMGARLSSAAASIGWDGASLTRDTSWQRELEMTLATMLGEKPIAGRVVPSEKSLVLLGVEGTVRSGDGIASGASRWARSAMPCPYIEMSRQDATRLGAEGLVKVASEHGESVLPVRVTSQLPAGVAIVSSQFAETRTLFGWESRPEVVEVSVVARETSTGGAKTHG